MMIFHSEMNRMSNGQKKLEPRAPRAKAALSDRAALKSSIGFPHEAREFWCGRTDEF